ncbi:putative metal-binding motif-containing protein [Myxococcota bacterium]|nr:putative metal-binding motif-containing protein [Myxococcota bacterium]
MKRALRLSVLLMFACDGPDQPKDVVVDMDGDGSAEAEDCDDLDPERYPGAPEVCDDGVVQDCLGDVEGARAACRLQGALTLNLDADRMMRGAVGFAGTSLDGGGNLDGDDLADLIIGVPYYEYYPDPAETWPGGDALVLRGAGALAGDDPYVDLAAADVSIYNESWEDFSGYSVAWAGDVDGDGLDDALVGSPSTDYGYESGTGWAFLLRSSSALAAGARLSLQTSADLTLTGEHDGDYFGAYVRGVGDVDADGLADVLVAASTYAMGEEVIYESDLWGALYLFTSSGSLNSGATSLEATMAEVQFLGPEDTFVHAVPAGAGDIDGDGLGDIVIGASIANLLVGENQEFGAVLVYPAAGALSSLPPTLSGTDAELLIGPDPSSYWVGEHVSYAGDVEGDGLDDLLIATGSYCASGDCAVRVSLFLSSGGLNLSAGQLTLADADLQLLGGPTAEVVEYTQLAKAGDVDGDGLGDLLISEHEVAAYLLLSSGSLARGGGVMALTDADLTMTEEHNGDWPGYMPSAAGDVNGDGLGDLLIGTGGADEEVPTNGDAYIVYGRSY